MRSKVFSLMAGIALFSLPAYSAEEILFGPEWEFSNFELFKESSKQSIDYLSGRSAYWGEAGPTSERILRNIASVYKDIEKISRDKIRVEVEKYATPKGEPDSIAYIDLHLLETGLDEDVVIHITNDFGVMEVTATPLTLKQWNKVKKRVQSVLFDTFKQQLNLEPGKGFTLGAGHLNWDAATAFEENLTHFRNFLVDRLNHSELSRGIHYGLLDHVNAKPLAADPVLFERIQNLIGRIDSGEIKNIHEAARQFNSYVFETEIKNPTDDALAADSKLRNATQRNKYSEIRIHTEGSEKRAKLVRIEDRAIRSQNSVEEFITQCKLIEGRVGFIKNQNQIIELNSREEVLKTLNSTLRYRQYVEESGLDWPTYRERMPLVFGCVDFFTRWFY